MPSRYAELEAALAKAGEQHEKERTAWKADRERLLEFERQVMFEDIQRAGTMRRWRVSGALFISGLLAITCFTPLVVLSLALENSDSSLEGEGGLSEGNATTLAPESSGFVGQVHGLFGGAFGYPLSVVTTGASHSVRLRVPVASS